MQSIDVLDFDEWIDSTSADYSELLQLPSLSVNLQEGIHWYKEQILEEKGGHLKVYDATW